MTNEISGDASSSLKPAKLPWFLKVAVYILGWYIRLVWFTGRWTVKRPDASWDIINNDLPYIAIFWHGRLLMMPKAKKPHQLFYMLTSYNKAGSFTSTLIKPFNIDHIRGSSHDPNKPDKDKGGTQALRRMAGLLKKGIAVGMTPDGSRGPRMRLSMGVIVLARLTGKPIMPLTFASRYAKILKGWDKLMIPLPFCKGEIWAGEPIYIPSDTPPEEMETWRLKVENAMNNLQMKLDQTMGLPVTLPDEKSV